MVSESEDGDENSVEFGSPFYAVLVPQKPQFHVVSLFCNVCCMNLTCNIYFAYFTCTSRTFGPSCPWRESMVLDIKVKILHKRSSSKRCARTVNWTWQHFGGLSWPENRPWWHELNYHKLMFNMISIWDDMRHVLNMLPFLGGQTPQWSALDTLGFACESDWSWHSPLLARYNGT